MLPAEVAGVLTLAACGSSGGSGSHSSTAAGGGGNAAATVQVRTVAGHSGVLVSGSGRTLYVSDQENGMVLCKTNACTAVWVPPATVSGPMAGAPATSYAPSTSGGGGGGYGGY